MRKPYNPKLVMMKSMIPEETSLTCIAHFLEHTVSAAMDEWETVQKRNEQGEFPEYEDYEAAVSYPVVRIQLASRAVYYEINSLVEHSLYMAAHEPWLKSPNRPGPKTLLDVAHVTPDALKSLRMVTDLRFKDVVSLIEGYYELRVEDLPGWGVLSDLRNAVNAFKHGNGYVDFRKVAEPKRLGDRYEAGVERAQTAIDAARQFLRAFHDAVLSAKASGKDRG